MTTVKDILINEDVQFKDGDFLVDLSDNMHIEHIIVANKGHYYQHPLIGVGIANRLKAPTNIQEIKKEISLNLEVDDMSINHVNVGVSGEDFGIDIDAERNTI